MFYVPNPSRRVRILEPIPGLILIALPKLTPQQRRHARRIARELSRDTFARVLRQHLAKIQR